MAYEITDYDREKEKIQDFLSTFYQEDEDGGKIFPYDIQIARLAKREQVPFFPEKIIHLKLSTLVQWSVSSFSL